MINPEKKAELDFIELEKIQINKKVNPRGPNVRENDPHRENLKESIAQFGILVPLVVRRIDTDKYELIDGERRYWIAKSLKKEKVPAFITHEPLDDKAILQRMFQIHMNREQWGPIEQLKASEGLYAELVKKHKQNVGAIVNDFAKFTGDDTRTARNRIQFLRWPEDLKREIYIDPAKHESYWYVVEIEDKIVEPSQKNYPEYFEKVEVDDVRRFLYRKLEEGIVGAAIDVRPAQIIFRSKIVNKNDRRKVHRILNKLVKDVHFTYEEAFEDFVQEFPQLVEPKIPKPRAMLNSIRKLTDILSQYQPEYFDLPARSKESRLEEAVQAVQQLLDAARKFLARMKK